MKSEYTEVVLCDKDWIRLLPETGKSEMDSLGHKDMSYDTPDMKWCTDPRVHGILRKYNVEGVRFEKVPTEYLLTHAVTISMSENGTSRVLLNHDKYGMWKIRQILRFDKSEADKVPLMAMIAFHNKYDPETSKSKDGSKKKEIVRPASTRYLDSVKGSKDGFKVVKGRTAARPSIAYEEVTD